MLFTTCLLLACLVYQCCEMINAEAERKSKENELGNSPGLKTKV